MGYYTTNKCFFTGNEVISCNETDGSCLDGYYYRIRYNNNIREFKLSKLNDWENDIWLKENGKEFLELVEKHSVWSFFKKGRDIGIIKEYFNELKNM